MTKQEIANLMVIDGYSEWKTILKEKSKYKEVVLELLEPFKNVSENLMFLIRKGINNNYTYEQIKLYARPEISDYQSPIIFEGLGKLRYEKVAFYADPKYNPEQMLVIMEALRKFEHSFEAIKRFSNSNLTSEQLEFVLKQIKYLGPEQIAILADSEYTLEQMQLIKEGFDSKLTNEQVALYAKPELHRFEMEAILKAIQKNISTATIELFNKTSYSYDEMNMIFTAAADPMFNSGMLYLCLNSQTDYRGVEYVIDDVKKYGLEDLKKKYKISHDAIKALKDDLLKLL